MGHQVDVLAGLAGVEEQEFVLVVAREKLFVGLDQVLHLYLQAVVEHQRGVFDFLDLQRVEV